VSDWREKLKLISHVTFQRGQDGRLRPLSSYQPLVIISSSERKLLAKAAQEGTSPPASKAPAHSAAPASLPVRTCTPPLSHGGGLRTGAVAVGVCGADRAALPAAHKPLHYPALLAPPCSTFTCPDLTLGPSPGRGFLFAAIPGELELAPHSQQQLQLLS
jgi:hypothetical protein